MTTTPTKRKRTIKEPTPMTLGHKGASLFVDKTVEIDNSIVISDGKNKIDVTFSNNNYLACIDVSRLDDFYNTFTLPDVDVDKLIIKSRYVEKYGYVSISQHDLKNIFQYILVDFVICNKQLVSQTAKMESIDKLYRVVLPGIVPSIHQNFCLYHNVKLPDGYLLNDSVDTMDVSNIKKAHDDLNKDLITACIYVIDLINNLFLDIDKKNFKPKKTIVSTPTTEEEAK